MGILWVYYGYPMVLGRNRVVIGSRMWRERVVFMVELWRSYDGVVV